MTRQSQEFEAEVLRPLRKVLKLKTSPVRLAEKRASLPFTARNMSDCVTSEA